MRWVKPLSKPNAAISHNLRRAAAGHSLVATQRQQSIGYRLLTTGCARRLQQSRMRVCKRRELSSLWPFWGITTADQGRDGHWASELSIMLECSHWLPRCRGLPFNGGCRESNRPSGKLRRPTPNTPHRHANVVLSPYYCRAPVSIAY